MADADQVQAVNTAQTSINEAVASKADSMTGLLESGAEIRVLKVGDIVEGTLLSVGKNEVYVDLVGYGVGVVRGRELYDDQATLASLKVGDTIFASVVESENKDGNIELSLRQAGHERVWQTLKTKMEDREIVSTKILGANKGGLMIEINGVLGFLPVSQLNLEHYPRVEDGDKTKILSALQSYVGQSFAVQIITADPEEEKLIVSEKAVSEKKTEEHLQKLKMGDVVVGAVTGVVDFGIFVKFGELEGLAHISELAWQRVENPKDLFRVGQEVQAKIIAIDKGRVSLSIKQLQPDPWLEAVKQYKIGQVVEGKVTKIMPFGVFVELSPEIQGLAHLAELSHEAIKDPENILKVGEVKSFKIISIEPADHRLGLSLKALEEKPAKAATKAEEKEESEKLEEKVEEAKTEEVAAE
ncbi:MAG: S1 RNA-binding domain-containing protein [Candidatus Doudnabacteria bacterium]|nr:S1 RNA-binding domain-containing protein [Candidatus Doudnabacteria bacterium]